MSPHWSQTQRASVSPGGTRLATGAAQLLQYFRQISQRLENRVGLEAEAVDRRLQAVDPVDAEAEGLRAQRVPAVRGDEGRALPRHVEAPHGELVDLRRGLEDVHLVDAQHRLE